MRNKWKFTDDEFFEGFGLIKERVDGQWLYRCPNGDYWRMDIGETYVCIEGADSWDMEHHCFDDVDLFEIDENMSREDILKMVRDAIPELLSY